jgi:type VI protein secretion system component Hcp
MRNLTVLITSAFLLVALPLWADDSSQSPASNQAQDDSSGNGKTKNNIELNSFQFGVSRSDNTGSGQSTGGKAGNASGVSEIQTGGGGGAKPQESTSLNFTKTRMNYKSQTGGNTGGGNNGKPAGISKYNNVELNRGVATNSNLANWAKNGSGNGTASGKRQHKPIKIAKGTGSASPKLLQKNGGTLVNSNGFSKSAGLKNANGFSKAEMGGAGGTGNLLPGSK